MSQTLGEKLRQARDEKGLTLSEVSEQTRISSLYLEAIEDDDYKILPGGIFNKGFVKSYAKFVGLNEQEALMDYSANLARTETPEHHDLKLYKPEVLTDDRSGSMIPTILVAAFVLALMTGGILYLVSYLRAPSSTTVSNINRPVANAVNEAPPSNIAAETPASGVPDMASLAVEVKAANQMKVIATVDADPAKPVSIAAGSSSTFNPQQMLTLSYNRWNAPAVTMTINGKEIRLPAEPLDQKDRDRIVFTISPETLPQIWANGAIGNAPPATTTDANIAPVTPVSTPRPAATAAPKPTAAANTAANTAKPPTNTAKPPVTTGKPTPKPPVE